MRCLASCAEVLEQTGNKRITMQTNAHNQYRGIRPEGSNPRLHGRRSPLVAILLLLLLTFWAVGAHATPALDTIANPDAILEDAGMQTVNLTGISGNGSISIAASSSDTTLIPNPDVTYSDGDATGSVTYTPVADAFGTATISVVVTDSDGSTTNTFDVTV